MIQKWRDYFTDECDTCGGDLTKDGVVYIINNVQGICADCYESVSIFLIDMDIDIKKKEKQ
tara:strand:- start:9449 stop:9631 length:183 start_codon:yes stop_codon:yes gene_type:complete